MAWHASTSAQFEVLLQGYAFLKLLVEHHHKKQSSCIAYAPQGTNECVGPRAEKGMCEAESTAPIENLRKAKHAGAEDNEFRLMTSAQIENCERAVEQVNAG